MTAEKTQAISNILIGLFSIGGLIVFLILFIPAINNGGVHYVNTSPMNGAWLGMSTFILGLFYCCWLVIFRRTMSRPAIYMWFIISVAWFFFSICCIIAFAVAPNDALAAGLSFALWTLPSALMVYSSNSLRKSEERNKFCTVGCCISGFFTLPIILFVFICTAAICIQAILSTNDVKVYQPMGKEYTVQMTGGTALSMHIYCTGSKGSGRTWIFEHGGGSNSIALKYVADEIGKQGYRACTYDRLGYGWSSSHYTKLNNSAVEGDEYLLTKLLAASGESGPYICVGHSAGAEKCLKFAIANNQTSAIGFVDGYPDLVRAAYDRKGTFSGGPLIGVLKLFAFLVGPTGFTRGIVGNPGQNFVPKDYAAAYTSLYAQSRYWYSQLWDVVADAGSGDDFVYKKLQGSRNETTGLITFGRNLNVKIGIFPADNTVSPFNCTGSTPHSCCGSTSKECTDKSAEKKTYDDQSLLYANTIGTTPGVRVVSPVGTDHGYPYTKTGGDWLAAQLIAVLL
jgi:pimeloyl-ACP methyl ester carboxylesterase